jgi:hypothetical protein
MGAAWRYTRRVPRQGLAALALGLALLAAAGCRTPVKEDVFADGQSKVFLRAQKSWYLGSIVERDFDHPVTIAPVRVAHILSRIDARIAGKKEPAIRTEMLFPIAEGISRALARAGSDQEVVVMAKRTSRHLGVFDHDYLTSMVVYVKGEQLFLHLGRLDWEVPTRQREKPPEPQVGEHPMSFRVYPSERMEIVDNQSVAVIWRDEIFAKPSRTKVLPTGKVVRKTILLESDEPELPDSALPAEPAPSEPLPASLTPEQLRALADLEEARRDGEITEAEYAARRQELIGPAAPSSPGR